MSERRQTVMVLVNAGTLAVKTRLSPRAVASGKSATTAPNNLFNFEFTG